MATVLNITMNVRLFGPGIPRLLMIVSGIDDGLLCYCKLAAAIRLSLLNAIRHPVALHPKITSD